MSLPQNKNQKEPEQRDLAWNLALDDQTGLCKGQLAAFLKGGEEGLGLGEVRTGHIILGADVVRCPEGRARAGTRK